MNLFSSRKQIFEVSRDKKKEIFYMGHEVNFHFEKSDDKFKKKLQL